MEIGDPSVRRSATNQKTHERTRTDGTKYQHAPAHLQQMSWVLHVQPEARLFRETAVN